MHVTLGWEYRGRKVAGGAVVYLALEGGKGFAKRVEAWRQRHLADHTGDVPFFLLDVSVDLIADRDKLLQAIRTQLGTTVPAAVVIDTLNRALVGDENKSDDMARFIRAADVIREALNCAVIIVHHCGVQGSRPRGHTSLSGAADAQIAVERDAAGNVVARVEAMKDGEAGAVIASRLEKVEVGRDDDGDPITSCVIVPVDGETADSTAPKAARRLSKTPRAAQIALKALHEAVDECGEPAPASNHIPAGVRVTTLARWRDCAYRRAISTSEKPRARQAAFQRASEYLLAVEGVGIWDETVWLGA